MIYTYEHKSTRRFAHLLGLFLVRRALSWSCWCWTPVRNSDLHSIITNIMIISLSCSVHIRIIVKDEWVSPGAWTHNDTWGPNIFYFIMLYNNTSSVFLYIISFYHNFPCIYLGCALCQLITLLVNHIISYISSCQTYVIS